MKETIRAILATFAHEFQIAPLYELGVADLWRAVEGAETKEDMLCALSFLNGAAQALRDFSPNAPRNGVTWLRLHHIAALAGILVTYVQDDTRNERDFERLIEETKRRYLAPLAHASVYSYQCDACKVTHELPVHFGKETTRDERLARAQWERLQARGCDNSLIASGHIRTAEAYEALALDDESRAINASNASHTVKA